MSLCSRQTEVRLRGDQQKRQNGDAHAALSANQFNQSTISWNARPAIVDAAQEEYDPQPSEYLEGLDLSHAKTLVLPKVPSVREYQRAIIQTCVMKNTLVSLPTGLGKTLIAAVVMHNFLRWFPNKKVVFLAPSVSALL
jgi:superfamily II DNA or RNA helicase